MTVPEAKSVRIYVVLPSESTPAIEAETDGPGSNKGFSRVVNTGAGEAETTESMSDEYNMAVVGGRTESTYIA